MKSRRKDLRISLILLTISLLLISSGIFIGYLSSPKRITTLVVNNLTTTLFSLNKKESKNLKNFTLNSHIKLTASSAYLNVKAQEDSKYIPYLNLLNNLNNMENIISLSQDNDNKKLLFTLDSYIYNTPYINRKYLIQNTTAYHYNPDLKNIYINNGNNNYFETVSLENYNLEYFYSKILESLKTNLDETYFITTQEEAIINNKKQTINKVTITIDNTSLNQIISFIIEDLKKDKTYFYILNSIDEETTLLNDLNNKEILSKDEKIIFTIYSNKMATENLKYELKLINAESKLTILYDLHTNTGQILENDELKLIYQINKDSFGTKIYINSKDNKEIGNIIFKENETKKEIHLNYDDEKYTALGDYVYEETLSQENILSKIIHQFNLRITTTQEEIININYQIDTNITEEVKIEEDVSTSIFKSSITEEEKELYEKEMLEKINKIYQ